jgi:hypothetical protein
LPGGVVVVCAGQGVEVVQLLLSVAVQS